MEIPLKLLLKVIVGWNLLVNCNLNLYYRTDDLIVKKIAGCSQKGFTNMADTFKSMGYISGLTL